VWFNKQDYLPAVLEIAKTRSWKLRWCCCYY